ncbi:hypothetical protein BS78_09G168700 [Paspalum vaginatum]|nr:hypothetical protein BS78_09G168700 [Paspalum vaginatum]
MEAGVDTASALMLLWRLRRQQQSSAGAGTAAGLVASGRGRGRVFECKTCGRGFPTFQALGGHRASHRRPKPYAAPGPRRTPTHEGECAKAGPRVHGCPVCGLEFAVGQALGGHMRRHRAAAADSEGAVRSGDATTVKDVDVGGDCAGGICLDLNLAPSEKCDKCRKNAVQGNAVQGVQKTLILGCPI